MKTSKADDSNQIKVYVRIRPLLEREINSEYCNRNSKDAQSCVSSNSNMVDFFFL